MGDRLDGRSLAVEARVGRFEPYSPNQLSREDIEL